MPLIAEVNDWEVLFHCCAAGHDGQKPGDTDTTIHDGKEKQPPRTKEGPECCAFIRYPRARESQVSDNNRFQVPGRKPIYLVLLYRNLS